MKSTPTVFFQINLISMLRSSKWFVSFKFSYENHARISRLPYACHMPCPYHLPSFDQPKNKQGVPITKLLIIKFSPFLYHFLPITSKYSPQHRLQTRLVYVFPSLLQTKFQRVQNNRSNYNFIHMILHMDLPNGC